MTLIAEVFPKLRSPKNKVRSMSIKSRFKGSFKKQHGKCAQTLLKFAWQNLYHIYWSLWRQLIFKKSLLVISKISRQFPNRLSGDGKYSLFKRGNLTQPIQMQVSRKQKKFLIFFLHFWNLLLILNIFKNKMTLLPEAFPKLRTPKKMVTSISKKSRFKGSFGKQHGKRTQRLLKFGSQRLYQIYWSLWRQMTCKKSLLVICKISRLFRNSLSADGKYSLFNRGNLTQRI